MAYATTVVPRAASANQATPARAGGASSIAVTGCSAAGKRLAVISRFSTTEPRITQDKMPTPNDAWAGVGGGTWESVIAPPRPPATGGREEPGAPGAG